MQISPQNRTTEDLVVAIQSGATELTEQLWERVQGLAKWKADRYIAALKLHGNTRGLEFDDLFQIGFIAMLDAISTYKLENGSFVTWFVIHIKKAFVEAAGLKNMRDRFDPINVSISLDLPLSDDPDGGALCDLIPDPSAAATLDSVEEKIWQEQLRETLEDILDRIPEKYRTILRLRYYENQTLSAAGNVLNVGTERARQLEREALRELNRPANAKRLKPFFDFNAYSGTGLSSFKETGLSVQERYLILEETRKRKADRHY